MYLTPRAFCQKCIFWTDQRCILRHFCSRRNKNFASLRFSVFVFSFAVPFFSFSYLFATVIDLLLARVYWSCFSFKNFRESIIETGTFCHRVATCSGRKFCSEFYTQISEHFRAYFRLHWTDHSDLGVQMMSILINGDDVRSGTKAKAGHRQQFIRTAQESIS